MKMQRTRFGDIRRLLEQNGFEMANVLGSHRAFLRRSDDTLLLFPPLRPADTVEEPYVAAAARILDERGVIPRQDFLAELQHVNGGKQRRLRKAI